MNSLTAIRFLRLINFPCDPIAGPEFHTDCPPATAADIANAILAITTHFLTDLSDSDWDALDEILYPTP